MALAIRTSRPDKVSPLVTACGVPSSPAREVRMDYSFRKVGRGEETGAVNQKPGKYFRSTALETQWLANRRCSAGQARTCAIGWHSPAPETDNWELPQRRRWAKNFSSMKLPKSPRTGWSTAEAARESRKLEPPPGKRRRSPADSPPRPKTPELWACGASMASLGDRGYLSLVYFRIEHQHSHEG
ncbi:hypothetical protein VUR80DRAFT_7329 [Thermomyces stellatus]